MDSKHFFRTGVGITDVFCVWIALYTRTLFSVAMRQTTGQSLALLLCLQTLTAVAQPVAEQRSLTDVSANTTATAPAMPTPTTISGQSLTTTPVLNTGRNIEPNKPANPDFPLAAAQAVYRVAVNGIPTGIDASIKLTPLPTVDQAGTRLPFELHFSIKSLLIKLDEISRFQWQDCYAKPDSYSHEFKGLGIHRQSSMNFDWQVMRANLNGSNSGEFEITDQTLDALGLAMTARCELSRKKQLLNYVVADSNGVEEVAFQVEGHEKLKTPAGIFNTIKVSRIYPDKKRKTLMWAAPELDYFMVRMDHIESPVVRGKIELKSLSFESESHR